jgi:hypothetical protein
MKKQETRPTDVGIRYTSAVPADDVTPYPSDKPAPEKQIVSVERDEEWMKNAPNLEIQNVLMAFRATSMPIDIVFDSWLPVVSDPFPFQYCTQLVTRHNVRSSRDREAALCNKLRKRVSCK